MRSGVPVPVHRVRARPKHMSSSRGRPKQLMLSALFLTTAMACGRGSHRTVGATSKTAPPAISKGQKIDLTLTGGVSARLTEPWSENNCTLDATGTRLFCELTTADINYHVYLNLQHYTGPGTYAANGERPKGSENIVAGLSFAVRDTAEAFGPVGGTVVIVAADDKAGRLGAGATVTGVIDADVQDKSAGIGAVKEPVHISGTFSTSLV
jgi:hypothetical protein